MITYPISIIYVVSISGKVGKAASVKITVQEKDKFIFCLLIQQGKEVVFVSESCALDSLAAPPSWIDSCLRAFLILILC